MASTDKPHLYIIAGPNGAGKSSITRALFPRIIEQGYNLDPDAIARDLGLSSLAAGRIALKRQKEYLANRDDFIRETTASGKDPLSLAKTAQTAGYTCTLIFVFIDHLALLKMRVAARVRGGGHDIPVDAQLRRFERSLNGGMAISKLADRTILIDNSSFEPRLVWDTGADTAMDGVIPRPSWAARFALPPLHRLTKRPQFLFVRGGKSERRRSLVIQARQHHGASTAIGEGFTATKKVGNAVIRNRSKRRLRAASAQLLPRLGLANTDYVFIARQDTATIGWQRLLDDMESALISLANTFKAADDP